MKTIFNVCLFILLGNLVAQAQSATDYWKAAVADFNAGEYKKSISSFRAYDELVPNKTTAHYYIAQSYEKLKMLDSAIHFYETTLKYHKSQRANKDAAIKLTRAYLRKKDFVNAYRVSAEFAMKHPGDSRLDLTFQDACLWPYLVKNQNLNSKYLTDWSKQISYIVNTVIEQKVIARNITNENGIAFVSDRRKNVGFAQRWQGTWGDAGDETISIHFVFTAKDPQANIEKQDANAMVVFQNTNAPMFERIGAMMTLMPFDKKELAVILEHDDLEIRYCACREMRSDIPKKYQKICKEDTRDLIKKAVAANPSLSN